MAKYKKLSNEICWSTSDDMFDLIMSKILLESVFRITVKISLEEDTVQIIKKWLERLFKLLHLTQSPPLKNDYWYLLYTTDIYTDSFQFIFIR